MAIIPITGNPHGEIRPDEVKVAVATKDKASRPPQFTDAAALKLVVQDVQLAEDWISQKQWNLYWRESEILYQSPRTISAFENSTTTRSNVERFTVAKHVNSLVPTMMSGIFYDSPPFVLRPRPGTTQKTTRAKTALFSALLDEIGFKTEVELGMESQCLNGTGIYKGGWTVTNTIQKKYVRKKQPSKVVLPFTGAKQVHTEESDEFEVQEKVVKKSRPFFEQCELDSVLVSPSWDQPNQIGKAKYLIHVKWPTFTDLDKLRSQDGYNIPSTEELKALFFAPVEQPAAAPPVQEGIQSNPALHQAQMPNKLDSADPLAQTLRMDERWDADRVIVTLNGKLIIRNEEHGLGCIPFWSANWWNIRKAGYGMGIGRLVGADQRLEKGTMNAAVDVLSFGVNQQYVRSRGANVLTQQIRSRLGGIIDVDGDVRTAFKILETPQIPSEAWQVIDRAKQSSESTSGADEAMVQGSLPGRGGSSIGRTATGAGNLAAANATKIQGPVGRFVDNVFIPFLIFLDQMIVEHMPIAEIRQILADEMGDDYEVDMENFMNARFKYEVLAGAHLAAKKAMAQSLPLMIQIFENPHMLDSLNKMGYTVDIKELFEMMCEMSEWKNSRDIVRKMSPAEQKSYLEATQGAAVQKVQADLTKISAKHQATAQEIDQKAEARLADKLTMDAADRATGYTERVMMEHAEQPQALGTKEAQYTTA